MKAITLIVTILLIQTAGVAAQDARIDVHLMSEEGRGEIGINQGMPLVLMVGIVSTIGITLEEVMFDVPDSLLDNTPFLAKLDSAFAPIRFAKPDQPWYESLVLQVESPGQKKRFRLPFHLIDPLPIPVETMDPDGPLHLFYGIDPIATKSWRPGLITIRAGMLMEANQDTVWSDKMKVSVLKSAGKKMNDYSKEEKYQLATYWMRRKKCREAEPYARNLYDSDSTVFHFSLLMADLEECRGNDAIALRLYRQSLQQFSTPTGMEGELPVFLMEKIMILQQKFLIITDE
ncbi:MAG: hypothetical protein R6V49_01875 [Bacteroidales bacterium]